MGITPELQDTEECVKYLAAEALQTGNRHMPVRKKKWKRSRLELGRCYLYRRQKQVADFVQSKLT